MSRIPILQVARLRYLKQALRHGVLWAVRSSSDFDVMAIFAYSSSSTAPEKSEYMLVPVAFKPTTAMGRVCEERIGSVRNLTATANRSVEETHFLYTKLYCVTRPTRSVIPPYCLLCRKKRLSSVKAVPRGIDTARSTRCCSMK